MTLPNHLPSFLLHEIVLALFLLPCFTSAVPNNSTGTDKNNALDLTYIRNSCGATLYPEVCYQSLSRYAGVVQGDPARLARTAIALAFSRTRRLSRYLSNATRDADFATGTDPRASAALNDCSSNVDSAAGEIKDSLGQMRQLSGAGASGEEFRFLMSNVQTWMSAALTDEETCTDGFEDVSDGPMKADVARRVAAVKKVTSNALALVNSYVNSKTN